MTIMLTNEQYDMLKYIVEEFTDCAHDAIVDYQKYAQAATDETIKKGYMKYAEEEEDLYNECKLMREHLDKFEAFRDPEPENN